LFLNGYSNCTHVNIYTSTVLCFIALFVNILKVKISWWEMKKEIWKIKHHNLEIVFPEVRMGGGGGRVAIS
jgi:hypothetical protein